MVPSEGCVLRAKGVPPDYSLSAATLILAPSHLDEPVTLCGPNPENASWEAEIFVRVTSVQIQC